MAELEAANAELRNTAGSQAEALKLARTTLNSAARRHRPVARSLGRRSRLVPPLVEIRRDARQGKSAAERRAVQAQAGARPTDELAATRMGSCARSSASSQARSSPWRGNKELALPDFAPFAAAPPRIEHARANLSSSKSRPSSAEMAAIARRRAPPPEPLGAGRMQIPWPLSPQLEEAGHAEAEDEPEATGSLAKFLSARKARRRGATDAGPEA